MEKIVIDLEVKSNKGVKDVEKLNKEINNTNKQAKETNKTLDGLTGGAITKFKNFKGSIGNVVKSFKSLRVAIIGTGIGALLIAVTSLGQAFTRSEEGQNKFAKLLGIIGSVTGNLLDLLADLGENIISVFENPKQAILNFVNLLKNNITNRFEGLLELIPKLGQAVSLLFEGKFSEAGKVAADSVGKVVLGVDSVTDSFNEATQSVSNFTQEIIKEGKIAGQIADQRAKADKIERKNIVDRAKANQRISELRFKAEQRDKFSAEERIKFLKEASALEEETTNKEIEAARLRFEAKKLENELTKSTKADKDEEAQLEAQLIALTTSKLNLQKRLQTSITTFQNEQKAQKEAEEKAIEKEKEDVIKAEEERDKKDQAELERLKKQSEQRLLVEQEEAEKKRQIREQAFNDLVYLAGAESKLGKALLIAKQIQNAKELAIEVAKTISFATQSSARSTIAVSEGVAQTAKIGFPQNIPMLIGYAAQAVGIVSAIKSATSKAKAPVSLPSQSNVSQSIRSSAPTLQSQSPAFNIVGSSGTNQLADAIGGQSQKPVKAYVVSNDVTTAQSMDRNIVEGASL